jgi:hypothetical protein
MLLVESPCGLAARRDLGETSSPAIDQPLGGMPKPGQSGWEESAREVSEYSTV